MNEFQVSGITYRTGKMDLFTQSNVIRRLAPVLGSFKDIAAAASAASADGGLDAMVAAAQPLIAAVAAMKDEDVNFVLSSCLSVVQRQDDKSGGWAKVWNAAAKTTMFDDMGLIEAWTIAANVLQDNVAAFFHALPTA